MKNERGILTMNIPDVLSKRQNKARRFILDSILERIEVSIQWVLPCMHHQSFLSSNAIEISWTRLMLTYKRAVLYILVCLSPALLVNGSYCMPLGSLCIIYYYLVCFKIHVCSSLDCLPCCVLWVIFSPWMNLLRSHWTMWVDRRLWAYRLRSKKYEQPLL